MKKHVITLISAAAMAVLAAFPALAGEWRLGAAPNDTRWWYDNGDGTWAANGWKWIDGNNDGIAECYYFDAEGWLLVNTVTPDQYTVDNNGAWVENGIVQTQAVPQAPSQDQNTALSGWQAENGLWRYYKGGQYLTSQWRKISNKKYYFDDDGYMVTGFQEIDGNEYYFDSDGALRTRSFTLDDVRYTVDSDGVIIDEEDGSDWETFQSDSYGSNSSSNSDSSDSSDSSDNSSSQNSYRDNYLEGHQDDYAEEVAELVNKERRAEGRAELVWNDELAELASQRAEELVEKYSHTRPDGRSCFTILSDNDLGYSFTGENIAMGQRTPEEVMDAWMNSTGHRKNILSSDYEELGVGCYAQGRTLYWVQLFLTER